MTTRFVQLVDQTGAVLATARVTDAGDHLGGTIDLHATPGHLRALFEEFEQVVRGQMFVFLDEVQAKIGAVPIKAIFDDGSECGVRDLQIFPSTGDVSFRLVGTARRPATTVPLGRAADPAPRNPV